MRPRPEGRGELGTVSMQSRPRIACASMRPRPKAVENSARSRGWMPASCQCFNAATARRPWRTRDQRAKTSRRCKPLQCGHGPKAVENRRAWIDVDVQRSASMRPRPEGRGERRVPGVHRCTTAILLQCGHGPKAVENFGRMALTVRTARGASMRPRPEGRGERWRRSRYRQSCADELQCGHGPKAVENSGRARCVVVSDDSASMRPRPEGRGEP